MKKGLLIVAAVLMLASVAQSGDLKVTNWPCTFTPQQLCVLPVKMNIGYYVRLTNQNDSINLTQVSGSTVNYSGCRKYNVQANFNCDLAASIAWFTTDPKGFVNGSGSTKSVTITPNQITNAPSTTEVNICVELKNLYLGNVAGGSNGVHVADVTVTVVPSAGAIPCTTL